MTEQRYLSAADLAAYIGASRNMIAALVSKGRLPKPIYLTPRMPRWDREAVDAMLGKCAKSADPIMDALDAAYQKRRQAHPQGRVG